MVDEAQEVEAMTNEKTGWEKDGTRDLGLKRRPGDLKPMKIGKDGRCICSSADRCPLGRVGMSYRCTETELIEAGFPTVKVGDMSEGAGVDVALITAALVNDRGDNQKRIAELGVAWLATLLKKNADYGGSVFKRPVLAPGCDPGTAILVRMSDKISRLNNLLRPQNKGRAEIDESVEDTMTDLGAYALLYLACPDR